MPSLADRGCARAGRRAVRESRRCHNQAVTPMLDLAEEILKSLRASPVILDAPA